MGGRAASKKTASSNGGAPEAVLPAGSIAAQARVAHEELLHVRYCVERANGKQLGQGHDDDHPFMNGAADGPVLTYAEYREHFAAYEARLRDRFSPAAIRLAEKRLADEDTQAEAG